ncbi:unnamed protein product [Gordionus sp. m RMFG-2023]
MVMQKDDGNLEKTSTSYLNSYDIPLDQIDGELLSLIFTAFIGNNKNYLRKSKVSQSTPELISTSTNSQPIYDPDMSNFDYDALYNIDDVVILDINPRLLYSYSPTKFVVLDENSDSPTKSEPIIPRKPQPIISRKSHNKSQPIINDIDDYDPLYNLDHVIVLDENPRLLYTYSPTKFVVFEDNSDDIENNHNIGVRQTTCQVYRSFTQ